MKRPPPPVRLALTALSLLGLSLDLQSAPLARLPNLILLYGDDIGYGDLGCNGATAVQFASRVM